VSDDFFTGYDILKHGEHDNEALGKSEIAFAFAAGVGSIHEELDPTPHLRIENQGSWPSCTGHAMTTVMECIAGLQAGRWEEIPQLSRKIHVGSRAERMDRSHQLERGMHDRSRRQSGDGVRLLS
jgi:hypothetical protein